MRNEDVLAEVDRRFTDQKNLFDAKFTDQKNLLDAKFTHLSAILQSGFDMAYLQRGEIIEHVEKTNGRVTKLEDNTGVICWINKNKKFAVILLVLLMFLIDFATDSISLMDLVKLIK